MQSTKTSNDLFLDNIAKFSIPKLENKTYTCVWNLSAKKLPISNMYYTRIAPMVLSKNFAHILKQLGKL
jgi:hypothetical protein